MNFHPNIPSLTPCLLHGWLIVLKSQGSEMKASNASLGTRHRLEPVAPMVLCRSGAEKTLIWLWFSLVILSKLMLCPTLLYKNIHGEFPLSLKSLYNELAIYLRTPPWAHWLLVVRLRVEQGWKALVLWLTVYTHSVFRRRACRFWAVFVSLILPILKQVLGPSMILLQMFAGCGETCNWTRDGKSTSLFYHRHMPKHTVA